MCTSRVLLAAVIVGLLSLPPSLALKVAVAQPVQVFNVALYSEPDFIDPHVATSTGEVPIDNAYESLVYMDRDTIRLKPVLAQSWTISPDGRVYTFAIRQGVKFQDGTVLDSNAVKANFDRLKGINKGPAWTLASVDSVVVKGPYSLEITVKPGGVPFLEALAKISMVSPTAVKEHAQGNDLAQDYLNRFSAGTGPYRILSWSHGQRLVLKRFEGYWGGWPNPNSFSDANFLIVPETATQREMIEKGEIDMAMNFPLAAIPSFKKNPGLQVIEAPGLRVLNFHIQYSAPPTTDVRVRQAVSYAFDASSFSQAVDGTFETGIGPVPALFLGNWKPSYPYKYNVAKAKALLNEAGYNESHKAILIADILNDDAQQKAAAEILQAGLRASGAADVDIRPGIGYAERDAAVAWQRTKDPATAHHLYALYTPARVPDAWAYLWYLFDSQAAHGVANNMMAYENPKFDALLSRALQQTNPAARTAIYRQAAQFLVDDGAALFVGVQRKIYVLRKNVNGFFPHPTWYPDVLLYYLSRG